MFPDHSRTTSSNSAIARVTWFFGYKTALATVIYLTGNRDQLKNQTAMAVRKNGGKWGKWREPGVKRWSRRTDIAQLLSRHSAAFDVGCLFWFHF